MRGFVAERLKGREDPGVSIVLSDPSAGAADRVGGEGKSGSCYRRRRARAGRIFGEPRHFIRKAYEILERVFFDLVQKRPVFGRRLKGLERGGRKRKSEKKHEQKTGKAFKH